MKVAIIGGGITALGVLERLTRILPAGSSCTIFDPHPKPGGLMQSYHSQKFCLELGPQTVYDKDNVFYSVIKSLALEDHLVRKESRSLKKYFIYDHGLEPIQLYSIVSGKVLPWRALCRAFYEPWISAYHQDESVKDFFVRRFGEDLYYHLVEPLIRGIWGGGGEYLSMEACFPLLKQYEYTKGSVIRGILSSQKKSRTSEPICMLSAKEGWSHFALKWLHKCQDRFEEKGVRLIWFAEKVENLQKQDSSWHINHKYTYDVVFHTGTLDSIPSLIEDLKLYYPDLVGSFSKRIHHSFQVVYLGGRPSRPIPPGFGALAPFDPDVLGVLFCDQINEYHAPPKSVLFRVMMGGALGLKPWSDDKLALFAENWLRQRGLDLEVSLRYVHTSLNVLPLPDLSLDFVRKCLREYEQLHQGLLLSGQSETKLGILDSLRSGIQAVERAAPYIRHLFSLQSSKESYASTEQIC